MTAQHPEPRFVVCIRNGEYRASLEVRKLYPVIADPQAEAPGQLRVIDESGEDYLYPPQIFAAIDLPTALVVALLKAS